LTEVGFEALLDAYPPHLRSVPSRSMRHLRDVDLAAFTVAMERIAAKAG
jgi:hypothetical protein